jgi:hypothetical protein
MTIKDYHFHSLDLKLNKLKDALNQIVEYKYTTLLEKLTH